MTPAIEERLAGLLEKATPRPWEVDTNRNEDGEYGGGPNCGRGYDDFLIGAEVRGKWATLLSTYEATEKLIDEKYDEDYHRAWDRVGEANAALIVEAVNNLPDLLTTITSLRAERDEAIRECAKWAREAGEAKGRLETSELAGIVDGWRERALKAEAERDAVKGALEKLACYDDIPASAYLGANGSYALFGDPLAVAAARSVLSSLGEVG